MMVFTLVYVIFHSNPALTEQEVLTQGSPHSLVRPPLLEVVDLGPPKGGGVVARQVILKDQYVCEYKSHRVYPVGSEEEAELAEQYDRNGEASSVLCTSYSVPEFGAQLCFDATRRFVDQGRLINHAPVHFNLKPGRSLYLVEGWESWDAGCQGYCRWERTNIRLWGEIREHCVKNTL